MSVALLERPAPAFGPLPVDHGRRRYLDPSDLNVKAVVELSSRAAMSNFGF